MSQRDRQRLKFLLLQRLEHYIFRKVDKDLDDRLAGLIERNDVLNMLERKIFYYAGEKWTRHVFPGPPQQNVPLLDESLHETMDKWLKDRDEVNHNQRPLVLGFMRKILNHTDDFTLILQMLPSVLHKAVEDVGMKNNIEVATMSTDEVAAIVGASERSVNAFKIRLMTDLLEG